MHANEAPGDGCGHEWKMQIVGKNNNYCVCVCAPHVSQTHFAGVF